MTMPPLGPPSRNPTIDGKLRTVLRFAFMKLVQGTMDDMLPAQVVAYDRASNMASVQPLISVVSTLNVIVNRAQIARVPVLQLGGGGFMLNFPIRPGDLGWIKANDRDISLFTQFWRMVRPNTKRMHSFEDGIFIPSILTDFAIDSSDAQNVVLQSINGGTRFSMGAGNTCITDESGYAQSVSAVLDVQSITRAFKIPSMTTGQRDAIPSPEGGMMVYVNDFTPTPKYSFYTDGIGWS